MNALLALLLLLATAAPAAPAALAPSASSLARDVETLTGPGMDGRGAGTPGAERAARRIAGWLEVAGLEPGGDDGTFFQSFPIAAGTALAAGNRLRVAPPAIELAVDHDWRPHGGSREGEARGELLFAGYGIARPDAGWDDYHGQEVAGKIVLALDGSPAHLGHDRATRLEKLLTARRLGAAALVLVSDGLPSLAATGSHVGIHSASITRAAADRLLAKSGRSLAAIEQEVAAGGAPPAFGTGITARLTIALAREARHDVNVIAVLAGAHPSLAREAVVVGAHYDHLGEVSGVVHPGADDNASGTAAVVGMARAFAAAGRLPRTLVFALFGAEEVGLLGSAHHSRHPAVPLDRTVAMVNLDMVGRLGSGEVHVGGVDSADGLRETVADAARATGVGVQPRGEPWAPSDHLSFYRAGVPVLFLTTGTHADYHRPSDVAERIDADGLARVTGLATRIVRTLAEGPRPRYVALAPAGRASAAGNGPFLGIVADLRGGDGVRVSDVVGDSGAARAGLAGGDVIVRIAGRSVDGFDTLRRAIHERRAGETIEIVYLRQGEGRAARATLGPRP
jgi:aminopeptidase YwaD